MTIFGVSFIYGTYILTCVMLTEDDDAKLNAENVRNTSSETQRRVVTRLKPKKPNTIVFAAPQYYYRFFFQFKKSVVLNKE